MGRYKQKKIFLWLNYAAHSLILATICLALNVKQLQGHYLIWILRVSDHKHIEPFKLLADDFDYGFYYLIVAAVNIDSF